MRPPREVVIGLILLFILGLIVVSPLIEQFSGRKTDRFRHYEGGGRFIGGEPVPSHDGRWFAYSSPITGRGDIFLISADGSENKRITTSPLYEGEPDFSKDGLRIAYVRESLGTLHIWIMNADGTGQRELTNGPDEDIQPCFSPDGLSIAFTRISTSGRLPHIYILNISSLITDPLSEIPHASSEPAFAPDGRELFFTSGPPDGIWRLKLRERDLSFVSRGSSPTVSPDGTLLGYLDEPFSQSIWVLPLTKGAATRVLQTPTYKGQISFSSDGHNLVFLEEKDSRGTGSIAIVDISTQRVQTIGPKS